MFFLKQTPEDPPIYSGDGTLRALEPETQLQALREAWRKQYREKQAMQLEIEALRFELATLRANQ